MSFLFMVLAKSPAEAMEVRREISATRIRMSLIMFVGFVHVAERLCCI